MDVPKPPGWATWAGLKRTAKSLLSLGHSSDAYLQRTWAVELPNLSGRVCTWRPPTAEGVMSPWLSRSRRVQLFFPLSEVPRSRNWGDATHPETMRVSHMFDPHSEMLPLPEPVASST